MTAAAATRTTRGLLGVAALLLGWLSSMGAGRPSTHVITLQGSRFAPGEVHVSPGDTVRFVYVSGGPHNVQFMAESISVAAQARLNGAMRNRILSLTSPMFIVENEQYELVVPDLPAGRYPFLCSPHWATMRGALVVSRK